MEWNGPSGRYFLTSDKGYTVCITFHSGEKKYTAWPAKLKPDSPMLAVCKTLAEAQQACEDDLKQSNTKQE